MLSKKTKWWWFGVLLIPAVALIMGTAATEVWADDPVCWQNAELNATDLDVGPRAFYDFEPYDRLVIENSNGKKITDLKAKRGNRDQGNAEYMTEGGEPPLWEVPFSEFFSRFPAGFYNFYARLIDGGSAPVCSEEFTHLIPCAPEIEVEEGDCGIIIGWNEVTQAVNTVATDEAVAEADPDSEEFDPEGLLVCYENGPAITIIGYEVIVEDEDEKIYKIDRPASAREVTVPPEFTEEGGCFEYEVLAIEVSGNQTITESEFYINPEGELEEECPDDGE